DLADYLVRRGVPFRTSHEIVGRLVRRAEERGVGLDALGTDELRAEHEAFGPDVRDVFDWEASVEARDVAGGTALASVRAQLEAARAGVAELEAWAADAPARAAGASA